MEINELIDTKNRMVVNSREVWRERTKTVTGLKYGHRRTLDFSG